MAYHSGLRYWCLIIDLERSSCHVFWVTELGRSREEISLVWTGCFVFVIILILRIHIHWMIQMKFMHQSRWHLLLVILWIQLRLLKIWYDNIVIFLVDWIVRSFLGYSLTPDSMRIYHLHIALISRYQIWIY